MNHYILIILSLAVILLGDALGDALGTLIEHSYECNHTDAISYEYESNRKFYGLPENANEECHF